MKSHPLRLLQISALILLGAGFYFPVLNFLSGSNPLHPEDNFLQWSFFKEFLSDPWNLGVILFSLYQAFLSAVLSILFGFPGAWLLTHYNFPGKHWFRLLSAGRTISGCRKHKAFFRHYFSIAAAVYRLGLCFDIFALHEQLRNNSGFGRWNSLHHN